MQPPYRGPYDEDDDPDELPPRSPLDLRNSYRNVADAGDRGQRARDDDRPGVTRSGLPVRPGGSAPDKKASDKPDKDKGGGLGLPFRRDKDDSAKNSPPSRSPFGVRGDDLHDTGGGRKLPFGRGGDKKPDKKPSDQKSGGGLGLPVRKGDSDRDRKPGSASAGGKESGGRLGGLFGGKGKDDKQEDRPARPAFGGSPPGGAGRSPGGKPYEEKRGRFGGLLGGKDKDDKKTDDKKSARPGDAPPRRGPFDGLDDERASRGFGSGAPRSGDSPLRSPGSGLPGDRSPAQRSPLGGAPGFGDRDRDRGPLGGPSRSPLGEGGVPRRSPLSPPDDDQDDVVGPMARPAGLGASRPQDRPALGGGLDRTDRFGAGARPGGPPEQRPPQRSPLGGGPDRDEADRPRSGVLPGLPARRGEEKAPSREPAPPGPKASRPTSRALPQTSKAPRIVKHGMDLDRKLDLIGVSLVAFALVVFFAVLPSMSFGLLPPVTGGLTGTINHFLSQLFGWGKIIWPLTSAVIGIWLMMRYFGGQMFDVDFFRVVGAVSLYACALTWLHFFELVNDPAPTVEAFRVISRHVAVELGEGGGWFGHQFYLLLLSQLGDWGAVSVMIAWLVASLMLTFDVSLVELGQFFGAMLAAFNVSPAQRARKREAQATADAATVGVTRPGETGPARPRQMPLAPGAPGAGAEGSAAASADATGARSLPVIRKPSGAGTDVAAPGAPPADKPPATAGEAAKPAADLAKEERGGLFGRKLPGLRRSGAPEAAGSEASEARPPEGGGNALAAAAAAGTGLAAGKLGRFLRRDHAAEDETPAKGAAASPGAAADHAAPAPVTSENGAPDAAPGEPPRRMSGFTLPTRDRPGRPLPFAAPAGEPDDLDDEDDADDTGEPEEAPDTPGATDTELAANAPRRPLRAAVDETPPGGLAIRPSQRVEPVSDAPSAGPEADAARSLPFANPYRARPAFGAPGTTQTPDTNETPDAGPAAESTADDIEPPVRSTGAPVRPGREDSAPPRRTLPFSSGAPRPPAEEPPSRPPLAHSTPRPERPAESERVRSFLDGINLPSRPVSDGEKRDEPPAAPANDRSTDTSAERDPAPPRGSGLGNLIGGAALAGAALAGASALGGHREPEPAPDDEPAVDPPARPARPSLRAESPRFGGLRASITGRAAAEVAGEDEDDEDDLDLLDGEDEDEEDAPPLFETPARPKGIVRPPQRPMGSVTPPPSDAGVRAANEHTARLAREDTGQTQPSDDFTRRARVDVPERPKRGDESKPVSHTHKPKRVDYTLPDITTLKAGKEQRVNDEVLIKKAQVIEDTLASFGAPGRVVEVNPGPVVTQFGVEPDYLVNRTGKKMRVKVGSIARLDADLALALAAKSIRIEAPVPGKGFVGIEVPNDELTLVTLRDVIESPEFKRIDSKLAIALGLGVDGTPVAADLTAMPHLLIAGTTGSGKSVCVNAIITCLLVNNSPRDVQFIMVDPKRVELTGYNGIPHLVSDVVVDLERIVGVLQAVQREMEARYQRFADTASRNIMDYNRKFPDEKMPYLVVVIDELADLMMLAPDETERLLARLAQMARATGIHLIISTQRPSVDIITGLIKANFPARIAFAVASSVDSRVILDQPGAEKLLGRGDMLYQSPDAAAPLRMQGVYVSDEEINGIINHWRQQKAQHGAPSARGMYFNVAPMDGGRSGGSVPMRGENGQPTFWDGGSALSFDDEDDGSDEDELYRQAVEVVQNLGKASISLLQRRLRIGYTRAARLIDLMEQEGIVGPAESGSKPREVLKFD